MRRHGFTLLESMVAMAILSLSLVAIFNLNAGAIASHSYTKKLTVATMLARSKMTDIEQKLYDDGFQVDDDEQSGDFSDEGFGSFKWRAKIVAPKTDGIPPEQLIGAIFNLPMGGGGDSSGLGSLFTGAAGAGGAAGAAGGMAAMGPMAGLVSGQFNQMVQSIAQAVREVHLTVSWKEGTQTESIDIVTHMVSFGPGSDRNGGGPQSQANVAAAAMNAMQGGGVPGGAPGGNPNALPGIPGFPGAMPGRSGGPRMPNLPNMMNPSGAPR